MNNDVVVWAPYTGPIEDGTGMAIGLFVVFLVIVAFVEWKGALLLTGLFWAFVGSDALYALNEYRQGNRNDAIILVAVAVFFFVRFLKKDKNANNNSAPAPQQKGKP